MKTMDMFSKENFAATARREVMEAAKGEGCGCPVCGQFVKVYKRTITSTMARQLITAYKRHGAGVVFHVRDAQLIDSTGGGDFAKLEFWGLVRAARQHDDGAKRCSGMWSITPLGVEFVEGRASVPKYCFIYNGVELEKGGAAVTIRDALGEHHNYAELMRPAYSDREGVAA